MLSAYASAAESYCSGIRPISAYGATSGSSGDGALYAEGTTP